MDARHVEHNVLAGEQIDVRCALYDVVTALMLCVIRRLTYAGAYAGPERAMSTEVRDRTGIDEFPHAAWMMSPESRQVSWDMR